MITRIAYCLLIIMLTSCKQSGEKKALDMQIKIPV